MAESTFAVGSSASTTAGRAAIARAMATRCCWPPESSDGPPVLHAREPYLGQQLHHPLAALRLADSLDRHHYFGVLIGAEYREQVVGLEHEADAVAPQVAQLLAAERPEVGALEPDGARRGRVEGADQVEGGGLAGPRRAADGRELPAAHRHREAAQRLDPLISLLVDLRDVLERDDRSFTVATVHDTPQIPGAPKRVAGSARPPPA